MFVIKTPPLKINLAAAFPLVVASQVQSSIPFSQSKSLSRRPVYCVYLYYLLFFLRAPLHPFEGIQISDIWVYIAIFVSEDYRQYIPMYLAHICMPYVLSDPLYRVLGSDLSGGGLPLPPAPTTLIQSRPDSIKWMENTERRLQYYSRHWQPTPLSNPISYLPYFLDITLSCSIGECEFIE